MLISHRLGTKDNEIAPGGLSLGGPGSGNWGHAGRKGQIGGSSSKGAGVSSAEAERATARRLAATLAAKAAEAEPEITKLVVGAVESLGGEMAGLDFRLKTAASIESKLFRDREESGNTKTLEQVASELTDLVRYTALFENEGFGSNVFAVQKRLSEAGWREYDSKFRNYFQQGNVYIGYNNVFINERTGQRYELQFHTPESLRRKELGHKIYEEFRELPLNSPRRGELMEQQKHLWDGFVFPDGADMLPGLRMGGK